MNLSCLFYTLINENIIPYYLIESGVRFRFSISIEDEDAFPWTKDKDRFEIKYHNKLVRIQKNES